MDEWAQRTHIPLTTADALGVTYARAHRWLLALKNNLIHNHRWVESPMPDPRMLFCLETSSIWRSSVGLPAGTRRNPSPATPMHILPQGPNLKLVLPQQLTSFFSPERRVQWQMVFHSDMRANHPSPPINDLLCLIQCLGSSTGVVTVIFEEHLPQGLTRTIRGLPPVSWINANEQMLVEIFGTAHFRALRKACSDTQKAFKLEVLPYRR